MLSRTRYGWLVLLAAATLPSAAGAGEATGVPAELKRWLGEQRWIRDTDGPVLELGAGGDFDDRHVFAPAVVRDGGRYDLYYPGSRDSVADRVFRLGLARSADGRRFEKFDANPVFEVGDGRRSVLTPSILRRADGTPIREQGRLRMWFSSTDFKDPGGLHTLHEVSSGEGIDWSAPSPAQLEHVYAPTVIRTGNTYRMWYTDVSSSGWVVRHASSDDGRRWTVTPEPALVVDQPWESSNLFYPHVMHTADVYLMWYASYWTGRKDTTAIGMAASLDGLHWYKHPDNPVLRPDAARPWESHYASSQSVIRHADGDFRIWYASRRAPPFVNKYFAINTARWDGPEVKADEPLPEHLSNPTAFASWRDAMRDRLGGMLGIPTDRAPLNPELRGRVQDGGIVVEKWIFDSEPGSRVPALVFRPAQPAGPMPAIVLTYGHGGSKSNWQYHYAAQVYARLGIACLAIDPIGEEERHREGRLGTRAHDPKVVHDEADSAGRLIMGKLVFDTMRGIDYLASREDIDSGRIGVAGNSLGGAVAGWMSVLEPRLKMAIVSGWAYDDIGLRTKYCTKVPNQRMREWCSWTEYASLAAPGCAVLVMNGDADGIIDRDLDGSAWIGTRHAVDRAARVFQSLGAAGGIECWFEPGGGHRPYFVYHRALEWIHRHLGTPGWTIHDIGKLPAVNSGAWCDANGVTLERLYGTPLHERGATLPDFGLRAMRPETLSCLRPEERGTDPFTLEGWLRQLRSADQTPTRDAEARPGRTRN